MTNVAGMLARTTPRYAFLTSLAKFTIQFRSRKLGVVHRACHNPFGSIANGELGTDFSPTTAVIGAEPRLLEGAGIECSLPHAVLGVAKRLELLVSSFNRSELQPSSRSSPIQACEPGTPSSRLPHEDGDAPSGDCEYQYCGNPCG